MKIVKGDLLEQNVDVIVNTWNQNLIPWFLLLPKGISKLIKNQGGVKPFNEVMRYVFMPLGSARLTSAGKLKYKGIIHVAGINMLWKSSEYAIRESIKNVIDIVNEENFKSVAFPVIGSGSGNFDTNKSIEIMKDEFSKVKTNAEIILVIYKEK